MNNLDKVNDILAQLEERADHILPISLEYIVYQDSVTFRANLKYLGQDYHFTYDTTLDEVRTDPRLIESIIYSINSEAPHQIFK